MVTQNSTNSIVSWLFQQLTWVKYVRCFGSNLPTWDNDLYTVPAGKKAMVMPNGRAYNPSVGSITHTAEIKVSGSYYKLCTPATLTTWTWAAISWPIGGIVISAGESFSVNTTTTAWLNYTIWILEFDATNSLSTYRVLALSNWDNTIYTCWTWLTAYPLSITAVANNNLNVCNNSWWARSYTVYSVPSGWAAGTTNQLYPASNHNDATWTSYGLWWYLSAWDFIVLNTNDGTAWQVAWINVFEI